MSPEGETLLDPEDLDALIPGDIFTRADLDASEQVGILEARQWLIARRRRRVETLLSESFLRQLHRRMFGSTWRWAGTFRTHDTNLGVRWELIPEAFRNLVEDARVWVEHASYPDRELAARLHHRLVQVHPFPNGNGRWARLVVDGLAHHAGFEPPNWGGQPIDRPGYIAALRAADGGDFGPLISFMWSDS